MEIPLNLLQRGEKGIVSTLLGPEDFLQRLRELGLQPGRTVEMVAAGEPCLIRIDGGNKVGFRSDARTSVLVEVVG